MDKDLASEPIKPLVLKPLEAPDLPLPADDLIFDDAPAAVIDETPAALIDDGFVAAAVAADPTPENLFEITGALPDAQPSAQPSAPPSAQPSAQPDLAGVANAFSALGSTMDDTGVQPIQVNTDDLTDQQDQPEIPTGKKSKPGDLEDEEVATEKLALKKSSNEASRPIKVTESDKNPRPEPPKKKASSSTKYIRNSSNANAKTAEAVKPKSGKQAASSKTASSKVATGKTERGPAMSGGRPPAKPAASNPKLVMIVSIFTLTAMMLMIYLFANSGSKKTRRDFIDNSDGPTIDRVIVDNIDKTFSDTQILLQKDKDDVSYDELNRSKTSIFVLQEQLFQFEKEAVRLGWKAEQVVQKIDGTRMSDLKSLMRIINDRMVIMKTPKTTSLLDREIDKKKPAAQ